MKTRTRDIGHFGGHPNPELMIFIAIVGILAAIAIPNLLNLMESKGRDCLTRLVKGLDGPLPGDVKCPKSDKPYAVVSTADKDVLACPGPEKHLDSKPEFVRAKGGPWTLRQTLPATKGDPFELDEVRTEIHQSPGRVALHVIPLRLNRYFFGPFFFTVIVAFVLVGFYLAGKALLAKEYFSIPVGLFFIAVFGTAGWFHFHYFATSHEWILERDGARLTRVDYRLGSKTGETVYTHCLGVIPTSPVGTRPAKLYVIHDPDAKGARLTALGTIPNDRLDAARWLNAAWTGP